MKLVLKAGPTMLCVRVVEYLLLLLLLLIISKYSIESIYCWVKNLTLACATNRNSDSDLTCNCVSFKNTKSALHCSLCALEGTFNDRVENSIICYYLLLLKLMKHYLYYLLFSVLPLKV